MKFRSIVIVVFFNAATAAAAARNRPANINRNGDACTDFFDYAKAPGARRMPIPDYMDRWSRRWQSGEVNKEHVRDILTRCRRSRDWPKGSAEQLAGDFYAACMDESRVDALGSKPIQPLLDEVRAIGDHGRRAAHIGKLHDVGRRVPFVVYATEDLHDPTKAIAQLVRRRFGPARPRLLPQARDALRRGAREIPRARGEDVRAGRATPASRRSGPRHGVRLRKAPCRSLARQRGAARPDAAGPHDSHSPTWPGSRRISTGASLLRRRRHAARRDLNVTQPRFLRQVEQELKTTPIAAMAHLPGVAAS